jgi:hypothetical protein
MVTIENNSLAMQRERNERKIKEILSKKFKLRHYRLMWDNQTWKMDIYIKHWIFSYKYIGFVYPSEHRLFNCVVIGGDPAIFRESAEELESVGISVTIQKPMD